MTPRGQSWLVPAALLVMPVFYLASFGPACWLHDHLPQVRRSIEFAYLPLTKAAWACPSNELLNFLAEYGQCCSESNSGLFMVLAGQPPESFNDPKPRF